ncbi:hypothetical protein HYV73_04960 [Candidatus Uhrbacteria bacterium]|nr:hypothetical protein [Candidatus Uhrbacteria bacterium]
MPTLGSGNRRYGPKAHHLLALQEEGFSVPSFVLFTADDLVRSPNVLATEAQKTLGMKAYAVRSSAFSEDTTSSSMAGLFKTRLNVAAPDLASAIADVCNQAREKLGSLDEFSLIVQQFIEPDFAGVTFTRDPQGLRETVLEYHAGRGENVVAGIVRPIQLRFVRSQEEVETELPYLEEARLAFLQIEERFGFPQDIEWCVKDGRWHFLQSRPLTTITRRQADALDYADKILPPTEFLYEKTGVTEVAPYATPLTLSLLEKLYAKGGPIDHCYQSMGVRYADTKSLVLVGNDLYTNRIAELHSLFPAFGLARIPDEPPVVQALKGLWTTWKNTRALRSYVFDLDALERNARTLLAATPKSESFSEAVNRFCEEYETVFQINLAAQRMVDDLVKQLPDSTLRAGILEGAIPSLGDILPPSDLVGNTLEFVDESPFITRIHQAPPSKPETETESIIAARRALALREIGRWIAIRGISTVRRWAKKMGGEDWAFFPLKEFLDDQTQRADKRLEARARALARKRREGWQFPSTLSSRPIETKRACIGVSSGVARGTLCGPEEIESVVDPIVMTEGFSADLSPLLSNIRGIIATQGGLLSHLSILCREAQIPAIVGADLSKLPRGSRIEMDGSAGTWNILD